MATRDELREALDEYVRQANANERVRRTLGSWTCLIHLQPTDVEAAFTLSIQNGLMAEIRDGLHDTPDLIVGGSSEDLADIFWGDANPASAYMQAAIKVQGSSEDVMRLDAVTMFIYLGS